MDWFLYDNGLRHERVKSESCGENFGMVCLVHFVQNFVKEWALSECSFFTGEHTRGYLKINDKPSK